MKPSGKVSMPKIPKGKSDFPKIRRSTNENQANLQSNGGS
jgi:hypothetical protein